MPSVHAHTASAVVVLCVLVAESRDKFCSVTDHVTTSAFKINDSTMHAV
jgi:hypothetical protein